MLWLTVWSLWQAASQVAEEGGAYEYVPVSFPFIRSHHRLMGPSFPQS